MMSKLFFNILFRLELELRLLILIWILTSCNINSSKCRRLEPTLCVFFTDLEKPNICSFRFLFCSVLRLQRRCMPNLMFRILCISAFAKVKGLNDIMIDLKLCLLLLVIYLVSRVDFRINNLGICNLSKWRDFIRIHDYLTNFTTNVYRDSRGWFGKRCSYVFFSCSDVTFSFLESSSCCSSTSNLVLVDSRW